jgi:hypothetical protein
MRAFIRLSNFVAPHERERRRPMLETFGRGNFERFLLQAKALAIRPFATICHLADNARRDASKGKALTPKLLILIGLALIGLGLLWMVGERFGLGRLPGDIVIERGNLRLYFPLTTSLLLSVVLSLLVWFLNR